MTSWEAIIHEHAEAVWRTAYRLVGNCADADECMQEAFVAAVAAARRGPVEHWPALLKRIVVSRGIDCLRRRARDPLRLASGESLASAAGRELPPDLIMQNGELGENLRWALGHLPRRHAQVVCLRYLSDLDYQEIASQLQISARHVGVILSRAREKLRVLLTEKGADHG
jgi:RNA polymerase sigma-70 factor, ECF subfamily